MGISPTVNSYIEEQRYVAKKHRLLEKQFDVESATLSDLRAHEQKLCAHLTGLQNDKTNFYHPLKQYILQIVLLVRDFLKTGKINTLLFKQQKEGLKKHESILLRMESVVEQQNRILLEYEALLERQIHTANAMQKSEEKVIQEES